MMPHHWIDAAAAAVLMLCVAPAGAQSINTPFAPNEDPTLVDADSPAEKFRVDFARVEHEFPLARADLMKLTPENVAELSQEQVDQVYARLTAGPIPDEIRMVRPGFYLGRAYVNKMFLLNFTLLSPDEANRQGPAFAAGGPVSEDRWPGEQVRRTAGR